MTTQIHLAPTATFTARPAHVPTVPADTRPARAAAEPVYEAGRLVGWSSQTWNRAGKLVPVFIPRKNS